MSDTEKIKRKLITALKLNGYIVRSEFATLIIESLADARIKLNNENFDNYLKVLCDYLEKHTDREKCIEKENILKAIETCIQIGYDEHEIKFNVIGAFNYPRTDYDLTRKHYFIDTKNKPQIIAQSDKKNEMFINRYRNVLQRAQRCFKQKNLDVDEGQMFHLNTVDSLLTASQKLLERRFILGSLYIGANGKYYIEDPTGMIELNLKHTKYHTGFYIENMFVLVNGIYSEKILQVSSMMLPPAEEFQDSKIMFTNLNYFGGPADSLLRDSIKLNDLMQVNDQNMMVFISDLWLDHEIVYEKVENLLEGFEEMPPIAIVFIGDFLSQCYGLETIGMLNKYFRKLAEIIKKFDNILKYTHFVFVPGVNDPCMQQILPRIPLPKFISVDFQKIVPNSTFTTNPCRIQYCSREIVVFRNDLLSKFIQDSLYKPTKNKLNEFLTKTITSQAHLSPFSLNAQPVHWDFDHSLHLYPLPNLIVIGDKCSPYAGTNKGCSVVNPGSFIESGFAFKTYIPASDTVDDCSL